MYAGLIPLFAGLSLLMGYAGQISLGHAAFFGIGAYSAALLATIALFARLTNEDAYALSKFMRVVVGTNNVDAQLDDGLDPQFLAATADRGLISDLETAKTVLVWGPDLKEEHPTLYLRVRRAEERDVEVI